MQSAQQWRLRLEHLRANKWFETFVIAVIVISALLIGAKTYEETTRYTTALRWMDWGITLFFLFEILIRMAAEPRFFQFFKKGWNIFDAVIVAASLIPIDDSEMVLLARLLRVFRVLRLVSMVPELRILVGALLKAIPRMGYVVLLMFIIFYIYGAVGSFLFAEVDARQWGNISLAMLTLFQVATFESWATQVLYPAMEFYPLAWIYFLSFIFLNAFVFLNMMIGIVLEVMHQETAQAQLESGEGEAADLAAMRLELNQVTAQLGRIEQLLKR